MRKQENSPDCKDATILKEIKDVLVRRPTYGYRRVTTILNANRYACGLGNINHKRIYRVMKENNLLLPKYASRPLRVHDGKIITLHSNNRWCSDGFYIPCDNGERVQVAFSLDTDVSTLLNVISVVGLRLVAYSFFDSSFCLLNY